MTRSRSGLAQVQRRGVIRRQRTTRASSAFGLASSIHAGVLVHGWKHSKVAIAEGVIAAGLLLGLLSTWLWLASTRSIALGVEGFAILGTRVGILTMAIGIGPRTGPDVALHALLIAGLLGGLITTWRMRPDRASI